MQGLSSIESSIIRIISRWEQSSHTLDYLLAGEFRQSDLLAADRAQVTEAASNWARGRGAAKYLLEKSLKKGPHSLPPPLRQILEVAICRIIFGERIPKPIIITQTVETVKTAFGTNLAGLANALLRRILSNPPPWPEQDMDPLSYLAASTSHPEWIIQRWLERWEFVRVREQALWDNQRPALWLRWNQLRGDLVQASKVIKKSGVEVKPSPLFPGFFRLEGPFYPAAADLVALGDFQVQDPSASLAVSLLDPQPGMEIVDLCAAPGGKTTLLAQWTDNLAHLTAVDISAKRLHTLTNSLPNLGITNVSTVAQDTREFADLREHQNRYDAVLLDVPCSGLGVLARRADLRWRRQPEDLPQLVSLQKELIRAGARCVKLGGILIYSTCSIEPQENQEVVRDFLTEADNFSCGEIPDYFPPEYVSGQGEISTNSPKDQIDGVYAARLVRNL